VTISRQYGNFIADRPFPSAPVFRADRALNDGYLVLVEPGFSTAASPAVNVVPTNNSTVDNHALVEARRTMTFAGNITVSGTTVTVNSVTSGVVVHGMSFTTTAGVLLPGVMSANGTGTGGTGTYTMTTGPGNGTYDVTGAILAANAAAYLNCTMALGSDVGASKWLMERTPQGGLHMIVSRTTDTINTWGQIRAPSAIEQWLITRWPTNAGPDGPVIAMSLWHRTTRQGATTGTPATLGMGIIGTTNGSSLIASPAQNAAPFGGGIATATTANSRLQPSAHPVNTPAFRSLFSRRWSQAAKPTLAALQVGVGAGISPPLNFASYLTGSSSYVLYRFAIADLTAAGISYADWSALEEREWAIAFSPRGTVIPELVVTRNGVLERHDAFTMLTDGRYFGDTVPTDPATIA
jgi:hypothetical protein